MKEKVKKILKEVFKVELDKINDNFDQTCCDKWDSINHITLIQRLEEEFNIEFDLMETIEMTSLSKIVDVICRKYNN